MDCSSSFVISNADRDLLRDRLSESKMFFFYFAIKLQIKK